VKSCYYTFTDNHSDDTVMLYHGTTEPLRVCGFHEQQYGVPTHRLRLLVEAFNKARDEINADITTGTVPETVASFAELHDYVDANEYGGLTEMETVDDHINGTWIVTDDMSRQRWVDFGNELQGALHRWIKAGRP
jgi:hypothetical protein